MTKYVLNLFLLFTIVLSIQTKFYKDYASFEDCNPIELCQHQTLQNKIKFFSRSTENKCSNHHNMDVDFLNCIDRNFYCGYIPLKYKEGTYETELDSSKGILIGNGLDLSTISEEKLKSMINNNVIEESLASSLGLKGEDALNSLVNTQQPSLMKSDGDLLMEINRDYPYELIRENYDLMQSFTTNFTDVHIDIKTALVSYYRRNEFKFSSSLWQSIYNKNWDQVYNHLRNGSRSDYKNVLESALILPHTKAYQYKNYQTYSTFLFDISKMNEDDFENVKKFLIDFAMNYGSRSFSVVLYHTITYQLIKFDNILFSIETIKNLNFSNYKSLAPKRLTGEALKETYNFINEQRNNTIEGDISTSYNIFLFSSGYSDDKFAEVAAEIRKKGVNIITIGFDKFMREELEEISGGSADVYIDSKISYSTLSCYSSRILNINKLNHRILNVGKYLDSNINLNTSNYYKMNLNENKNMMINLNLKNNDLNSDVKMFVSYVDPYPDEHFNDFMHLGRNRKNSTKLIVIPGKVNKINITNIELNSAYSSQAYIALKSNDSSLTFDFEISECDVDSCVIGTNDIPIIGGVSWILVIILILAILFLILFVLYVIRCYRKPQENVEFNTKQRTSNYHKLAGP